MRVLLFSRYGAIGASSRIRSYQYLSYLKRSGIEVTPMPLFDNAYLNGLYSGQKRNIPQIVSAYLNRIRKMVQSNRFNLIWIEKELLPWLPAWFEIHLKHRNIPFMVDYDDAIFHHYDLNPHGILRWLLGRKIDGIMGKADLVTVGNRYLAQRASRAGAVWVQKIPTVVDLKKYRTAPLRGKKKFTIGWIGSPTTTAYLKLVEQALVEFCRKHPARVTVIGAGNLTLSNEIPVESLPWSEENEVRFMAGFDVGIMPLPDTPWARGKCGYKLIQYMACGKPVIASSVSADLDIIQIGESGFLAGSQIEWLEKLETLYRNRELAVNMGKKGRKIVATRYCIEVTAPFLTSLMRQVVRHN